MVSRLFSGLFSRVMAWSRHQHAPYYLAGLSFAEASFFPIPPDVMLAPMSLAEPRRAWRYATVATLWSVIGGVFGYLIGFLLLQFIYPYIVQFGYVEQYQHVLLWFKAWGIWVILLAGFTPIPYKLFTIAAGALHMAVFPFLLCSIIGRGMRFYLVSGLMKFGGQRFEKLVLNYIDYLGWFLLSVIFFIYIGYLL